MIMKGSLGDWLYRVSSSVLFWVKTKKSMASLRMKKAPIWLDFTSLRQSSNWSNSKNLTDHPRERKIQLKNTAKLLQRCWSQQWWTKGKVRRDLWGEVPLDQVILLGKSEKISGTQSLLQMTQKLVKTLLDKSFHFMKIVTFAFKFASPL